MSLLIRPANEADLPLLAQMNKRLIEDEGSRNPDVPRPVGRPDAGLAAR